jgi:hypothetical protein
MDDDIRTINLKGSSKVFGGVRKADPKHFIACFELMEQWMRSGIAHVGFAERMMAARPTPKPYYENGRMGQAMFYDLNVVRKVGASFNRVTLMQDLDMNLQLLEAGYPNRVSTRYSYTARPEDYAGGCGLYRTDTLKKAECLRMQKLHPGIVEAKTKVKFGREYPYLRTSWRKAIEMGNAIRGGKR